MDAAIATAARALSMGDPLRALGLVALRQDGPALAMRGIAMAQLGELKDARRLLRSAAKAFGPGESAAAARCRLAEAEVALAQRDLRNVADGLEAVRDLLTAKGDRDNVVFAQLLEVRWLLLLGEVERAATCLARVSVAGAPWRLVALACLAAADLGLKRTDGAAARTAAQEALVAARQAGIPTLLAEVETFGAKLATPVARRIVGSVEEWLTLEQLRDVFRTDDLIVDVCQRQVRCGSAVIRFTSRPVLLELAAFLARHAPQPADRETLIRQLFGAKRVNDSHRVRLRVEVARLRRLLRPVARLTAVQTGFVLLPEHSARCVVLLPPSDGDNSALLALLRNGDAWGTASLAEALGKSQRAVQRALAALQAEGKVEANGKGRAQRWVAAPSVSAATSLSIVAPGTLA